MAKEAYYFSHDSNARHDPKVTAMRSVYGSEGYGWYWILVELMREADGYKLTMQGKYTFDAYAKQMDSTRDAIESYVHDCVTEFNLFDTDGEYFWSNSLLRRMELREKVSSVKSEAAKARWAKTKEILEESTDAMHMHSISNAIKGKEIKESKEKKLKEYKDFEDMPHVKITHVEYQKLIDLVGNEDKVISRLYDFASWILTQPKKKQETSSPYLSIMAWHKKDLEKTKNVVHFQPNKPAQPKLFVPDEDDEVYKMIKALNSNV